MGKKAKKTAETPADTTKESEPAPARPRAAFKAEMLSARVFQASLDLISYLIDETYIYFDAKGMMMAAIDAGHVGMITAMFPKDMFTTFECSGTSWCPACRGKGIISQQAYDPKDKAKIPGVFHDEKCDACKGTGAIDRIAIGITIADMLKVLKRFKGDDELRLTSDLNDSNVI